MTVDVLEADVMGTDKPRRAWRSYYVRARAARLLAVIVAGVAGLVIAVPLLYEVVTSLKPVANALQLPIRWIPSPVEWSNYSAVFGLGDFARYFINSGVVVVAVTFLNVATCSLAGYSLAKFDFRGKKIMLAVVMMTLLIPIQILYVPLYVFVYRLGWVNSYAGLIIPAGTSALGVFIMRQGLVGVPDEFIEAARIDGASELRILVRLVLPLVKASVTALAILVFMDNWSSFLWPLIVESSDSLYTVPVGLAAMESSYSSSFTVMLAAAVLSSVPTLITFFVLQRHLVGGILGQVAQK
jgi:multiple sugar transport system permease protein